MNYKRKRPRASSASRGKSGGHWLRHWPKWWDVVFHNRPRRSRTRHEARKVLIDPDYADRALWPLSKKPHIYYW